MSLPFTLLNVLFVHVTGNMPVSLMTCSPGGNPLMFDQFRFIAWIDKDVILVCIILDGLK